MKNITTEFREMLESSTSLVYANLYTFTLKDGTVLRWTDAQQPLMVGANTWSVGPVITREGASCKIGVEVQELQMTLSANPPFEVDGLPWMQAIARLRFDDAMVSIDKFLSPSWTDTSRGTVNLFSGVVGDIAIDRLKAQMTVNSLTVRLQKQFPVNYLLPSCVHTLFDAGCTLAASAYQVSGVITDSAPTVFGFETNLTQADGWFALGKIEFLTGPNSGAIRSIKSYVNADGKIMLVYPLEAIPLVGDSFHAWAGCDKMRTTCASSKFDNLQNFRGFPFVPTPATVNSGANTQAPSGSSHFGGGGPPRSGRGQQGALKVK